MAARYWPAAAPIGLTGEGPSEPSLPWAGCRSADARSRGARVVGRAMAVLGLVTWWCSSASCAALRHGDASRREPARRRRRPGRRPMSTATPRCRSRPPLAAGTDLAAWAAGVARAQRRARRGRARLRRRRAGPAGATPRTAGCPGRRWPGSAGWSPTTAGSGGPSVDADGVARPSIIGVPLDGSRGAARCSTPTAAASTATPGSTGPSARCSSCRRPGPATAPTATATACATPSSSTTPRWPRPATCAPMAATPPAARAGGTACSPTTAPSPTPAWSGPPPSATRSRHRRLSRGSRALDAARLAGPTVARDSAGMWAHLLRESTALWMCASRGHRVRRRSRLRSGSSRDWPQ